MKKILIIISLIFLITGCSNINDLTYDEIIQNFGTISSRTNTYRTGYKYYLPRGMQVNDSTLFNEILEDGKNTYYLYVDAVSYLNQVDYKYEENSDSIYSTSISNGEYFGYVEINLTENDKYLVEIMYNYAKIEVIVDKYDLSKAISNSLIILSSVKYNSEILETIVGENILTSKEIEFNIFETKKTESNFLEVEANNIYVEEENDPDLIN